MYIDRLKWEVGGRVGGREGGRRGGWFILFLCE